MIKFAKIRLIFFILFAIYLGGCNLLKPSSRDKAMAEERKKEKESAREIQAMEKAHYKAQPADTRKMMKKSYREAKKLNRSKRR
ncbi:MAG: hypothetical protein IPN08_11380 [Bacteroidales bacterium]|nr:hypothetical protein [Bacteroidales bacterium]MBK9357976.1 hypothetical protein [Bacteroidales bacterium]